MAPSLRIGAVVIFALWAYAAGSAGAADRTSVGSTTLPVIRSFVVTLAGHSDERLLSMPPSKPIGSAEDGALIEFALSATEPLPARIAKVAGQVRWELNVGRRTLTLGLSQPVLLVTAGPPRRAESWPVAGVPTEPALRDHNAFTAFRLEHAVLIAGGARSATEAAERVWRYAMHHYDLSADSDLNPWELLDEDGAGQCMTVASFIEAAVKILGFPGGRVAEDFLTAACTAVVWAYEDRDSDEWTTICDQLGPGYRWGTGEPFQLPNDFQNRGP